MEKDRNIYRIRADYNRNHDRDAVLDKEFCLAAYRDIAPMSDPIATAIIIDAGLYDDKRLTRIIDGVAMWAATYAAALFVTSYAGTYFIPRKFLRRPLALIDVILGEPEGGIDEAKMYEALCKYDEENLGWKDIVVFSGREFPMFGGKCAKRGHVQYDFPTLWMVGRRGPQMPHVKRVPKLTRRSSEAMRQMSFGLSAPEMEDMLLDDEWMSGHRI